MNFEDKGLDLLDSLKDGKITGPLADEWEVESSPGNNNFFGAIVEGEKPFEEIQVIETRAIDTIYTFKRKT